MTFPPEQSREEYRRHLTKAVELLEEVEDALGRDQVSPSIREFIETMRDGKWIDV